MIVCIPMAGEGKRFADAGYTFPKPLISVRGKPMIQWAVEGLGLEGTYVFICQKEHLQKYALQEALERLGPKCHVVGVDAPSGPVRGAVCTVLEGLSKVTLDPTEELVIANCDQWIAWQRGAFLKRVRDRKGSGGIVLFHSVHPKWSFAAVVEGNIVRVAEKRPISKFATCGVYYYRSVELFRWAADTMMKRGATVNGEYYVAPTYNEIVEAKGVVVPFFADEMWGLGTPEDLEEFKMKVCSVGLPMPEPVVHKPRVPYHVEGDGKPWSTSPSRY